jgi:hypothetical protein
MMLTTLLALGGRLLANPALLAGIIGISILGIREFQHWREVNGLEKQIATISKARDDERTAKLETIAALSDVTANRDRLVDEVKRQNDAIASLQQAMQQKDSAARLAAVRAFAQGREAAEALRQPTTTVKPGAAEMNAWLCDRLGAACATPN